MTRDIQSIDRDWAKPTLRERTPIDPSKIPLLVEDLAVLKLDD